MGVPWNYNDACNSANTCHIRMPFVFLFIFSSRVAHKAGQIYPNHTTPPDPPLHAMSWTHLPAYDVLRLRTTCAEGDGHSPSYAHGCRHVTERDTLPTSQ